MNTDTENQEDDTQARIKFVADVLSAAVERALAPDFKPVEPQVLRASGRLTGETRFENGRVLHEATIDQMPGFKAWLELELKPSYVCVEVKLDV